MDRDLENHRALERDLLARAQAILAGDGIAADGAEEAWLSIDVRAHATGEQLGTSRVLVSVRVNLSEPVRLVRDPSLTLPGRKGAVTWSREWVGIESTAELAKALEREGDLQVGLVCGRCSEGERVDLLVPHHPGPPTG